MQVAFFDSGIGGLSVLVDAQKLMPNEQFIYFADTQNVPYGTKSHTEIKTLVYDAVEFLNQYPLKALVLACNTATCVVVNELRQKYSFPIVGMEPAVKPAAIKDSQKNILVCATERTLSEEKLDRLIETLDTSKKVQKCSLQKLVNFAENFDFLNPSIYTYLDKQFENINWENFDSLVLGCTHFIYFKNLLRKYLPAHIEILDGNLGTINRLMSLIKENKSLDAAPFTFYNSKTKVPRLYFDHYLRYLSENQS